jgi:dephospho-CoA kinase
MLVVGLTGGIGSGKTTVADLFAKKGIDVIDTDQLARDVTEPGQPALAQIAAKFGPGILSPDGRLDRTRLRNRVFSDPEKRIWLEQLLHPLIRARMAQHVAASSSLYCIVVIPLLFESAPNPLIQRTLVVDLPETLQLERTIARDKMTSAMTQAIVDTQISREKRLSLADDIIYNQDGIAALQQQVDQLHETYCRLAQNGQTPSFGA